MDATANVSTHRHETAWSRVVEQLPLVDHAERRSAPRVRLFKKGKLIHPNNTSVFDCIIRDLSDNGARLSCDQTGLLPNELQLMFHALREVRHVRVIWRRPGELGVQFLTPPRSVPNLHL
jgi:hypothetical protein